jgi:ribosomal protein S24E
MAINISNAKNRDATVALEAVRPSRDVHYIDEDHNMVMNRRLLKTDVQHDLSELTKKEDDLGKLAKKLVKDDPEIDIEKFGMFLGETSRVYVSEKGIVHSVEEFEVITNPDGTVRDRRPRKKELQNINSDVPLKWSGKFIKKKEAVKKFVFGSKKQLIHVNGLTYDFLFEIAKELHDKDSLMLVRGGEKGDKPIVLNRGGKPYNAFLEGRVDGDAYCLILHLSNMELKKPKPIEIAEPEEEPKKAPKKTQKTQKAEKSEKPEKPKKGVKK